MKESAQIKDTPRQPPAALEVEKYVLGALLLEEEALPKVFDILKSECFYDKKHRVIFDAIDSLFKSNEPVDTISLFEELKKSGKLTAAGGAGYISKLTEDLSSAANVDYHSRVILEKWILRQLINTSMEIASSAYEGTDDVFDIVDSAETQIMNISQEGLKSSSQPLRKVMMETLELIEMVHSKKSTGFFIPSGYKELDNIIAGFHKSDLIIIAGRPAMGKTAFAISVARNIAVDRKIPIAFFTLEMSAVQLVTRLLSAELKMNAHSLRTGKFKKDEYQKKIVAVTKKLSDAPIFIDDTPSLNVMQLKARARRLKTEQKIELIIVDYLQFMSPTQQKFDSREREISMISRTLKTLAKELNIPVIALAQLSRATESERKDRRPMLSHLRESGAIEQDADVVMFLYRPEVYGIESFADDSTSTEGIAEILVAKQRNGPIGDIRLKFLKEYTRFENLELQLSEIPMSNISKSLKEDNFPF
ncbi:MAG: replicative DNA helicase [Ignavibacteriales bacterium]|nr:replicative DNA helicase [Ignavibacteriales bacterium]